MYIFKKSLNILNPVQYETWSLHDLFIINPLVLHFRCALAMKNANHSKLSEMCLFNKVGNFFLPGGVRERLYLIYGVILNSSYNILDLRDRPVMQARVSPARRQRLMPCVLMILHHNLGFWWRHDAPVFYGGLPRENYLNQLWMHSCYTFTQPHLCT